MSSAKRALVVMMLLILLGAWGCSRCPGNTANTGSARIRDLESRNGKLEEDYRIAMANLNHARKKAAAVEEMQVKQQDEVRQLIRERDELLRQVTQRAGERDSMQAQLVQFGKELQNLLSRIDAAASITPPSATTPVTTAAPAVKSPEKL